MAQTPKLEYLYQSVRDVPDFPEKGILFKDITTLLKDPAAYKRSVQLMAAEYKGKGVDLIVAVESRGFIFGSALAYILGAGLVPVRKKGKLPAKTRSVTYQLEYGTDTLEIHRDAISPGSRVLIVDDLLATGGTVSATARLVKSLKAEIIGVLFLIELSFLNGRKKLKNLPVKSVLTY